MTFDIPGEAPSKGSKRLFHDKAGGAFMVESASGRLRKWGKAAKAVVLDAWRPIPTRDPVYVCAVFYLKRAKGAHSKGRLRKPDIDKAARALLDVMTGIAYCDDSQVVGLDLRKDTAAEPHTTVYVSCKPADTDGLPPAMHRAACCGGACRGKRKGVKRDK